jgi:mannitol-specific phosphotransferase system IIBC component
MPEHLLSGGTKAGTMGGTLLIILANISTADLLKTAVLAAVGAVVSFGVSLLLKRLLQGRPRRCTKRRRL